MSDACQLAGLSEKLQSLAEALLERFYLDFRGQVSPNSLMNIAFS